MYTRPVIFLLTLLLAGGGALAQSNYAVLSGRVADPQGGVLPGATVRVASLATNAERAGKTDEQGAFQITGLLPGDYELIVEGAGFAPWKQIVRLEVAQRMSLDIR